MGAAAERRARRRWAEAIRLTALVRAASESAAHAQRASQRQLPEQQESRQSAPTQSVPPGSRTGPNDASEVLKSLACLSFIEICYMERKNNLCSHVYWFACDFLETWRAASGTFAWSPRLAAGWLPTRLAFWQRTAIGGIVMTVLSLARHAV